MKINKALLTYIGINRDKSIPKSEQFSVEITGDEFNRIKQFPFPFNFTGTVTRIGNKSPYGMGDFANNFCNPFHDFYRFHHAGWKIETCICETPFHGNDCPLRVG